LHLKCYPNKATNNKNGKGKGGHGGGNGFQIKGKITNKTSNNNIAMSYTILRHMQFTFCNINIYNVFYLAKKTFNLGENTL